MKEKVKYIPWFPFEEAEGKFDIIKFCHTLEGLTIDLLKQETEKKTLMRVTFPGHSTTCRYLNETYRGKTWQYLKQVEDPCGPLFKVEGRSDYIKSLSEESYTLTDEFWFKPYYIADIESTFDIASQEQPQIELFVDNVLVKKIESIRHGSLKNK
jgi:hypothetical protein